MNPHAASKARPLPPQETTANGNAPGFIGRFQILGVLGKGSQGVVYLAQDPTLQRQVAIKTLHSSKSTSSDLLREARTAGKLKHPNIVPVYESGEHGGAAYLVYEYVEGQSLRDALRREGKLTVQRALDWMNGLLDAMGYAHGEGIVHRDLNPSNIRIDRAGVPRITDFGISIMAGSPLEENAAPRGTVHYMAPEQLSASAIGPAADLFALGLILYEMLTGQRAVTAEDPMAAMYQIAHAPIVPPSQVRTDLGKGLDPIVLRALEKEPSARYASAQHMKQALQSHLQEAPGGDARGGKQSTLDFVLRRMRHKSDFPAISGHIAELSRKTSAREVCSVSEVANVILKDYALTSKLLKLVNSSYYGQYSGRISTVSRAVVALGFDRVRMAAQSLLLFEHLKSDPQAAHLKDAASRAFLSGAIGRRLAGKMPGPDPEEAFVCALLRTLGVYLTIYYLPEEYAEIRKRIEVNGEAEMPACQSVLGITFDELGRGVAREWQLPDTIVQSMHKLPDRPLKSPANPRDTLIQLSALANELCDALVNAPEERRSAALKTLQERFGSHFPIDDKRLRPLIASALEDAKTFEQAVGAGLGGSQPFQSASLWLSGSAQHRPRDPSHDTTPATGDTVPARTGAADMQAEDRRQVLINGIQDVTDALLGNESLNNILVMVLETIFRGLGFTRAVLCIVDRGRGRVSARFGLGKDVDRLIPRFRFPVTNAGDKFSRAVNERRDQIYSARTGQPSDLPPWFRQLAPASSFVVCPLTVNHVCIGLIYCDVDDSAKEIEGGDLNYLSTLCNQAALAIKQCS